MRPRVRVLIVFLLCASLPFATVSSAWAEETPITETVFIPPLFYVGDQVEVRLTLLLPEGKALLPP